MHIDWLLDVFRDNPDESAVIWNDAAHSYAALLEYIADWHRYLDEHDIGAGNVIAIEGDYSPRSISLVLTLVDRGCIIVPLSRAIGDKKERFLSIAQVGCCLSVDDGDTVQLTRLSGRPTRELLAKLIEREHPGLILFSSGSTGESKAIVHDLVPILDKFKVRRHTRRAIAFLLFDHIGGFNTMLYQLSNAGCIVTVRERDPDSVLRAVEAHEVELLPTSPTFMNLVLLSEAYERYDLSSLRMVTYGTEPMLESTLRRFREIFPDVELLQTYGMTELGILRSKSQSSSSIWVKVGGGEFQTRVVDGVLHVRAASAMLGYLNAPSPFTDDGWFNTGDRVEVDGEYIRFKGRDSQIINVGGQKVYPAEVESVIQEMDEVAEVTVHGEKNPIVGQLVCATIRFREPVEVKAFSRAMRAHCKSRLEPFQIPARVRVAEGALHSERYKKMSQDDPSS